MDTPVMHQNGTLTEVRFVREQVATVAYLKLFRRIPMMSGYVWSCRHPRQIDQCVASRQQNRWKISYSKTLNVYKLLYYIFQSQYVIFDVEIAKTDTDCASC